MNTRSALACIALVFGVLFAVDSFGKAKTPEWLTKAAAAPNPKFDKDNKPEAVILWDEGVYEYLEDGTQISTYRYAIRVIEPSGRNRARVSAYYRKGSTEIEQIKAWNIDREGEVYAYKNSDIADGSASGYSLYSENMVKQINGKPKSRVGSVFGYEYTRVEKSVFSQDRWYFQSSVPVVLSRLDVRVPDGWTVKDTRFNNAPKPAVSGNRYLWVQRDMPTVESETNAPYRSVERSFITIDVRPPEEGRVRHSTLSFNSWGDLCDYTAEIQDPKMAPWR